MRLFALHNELEDLLGQATDHETGELRPEFEAALAELEMAKEEKLENCALYYKGLVAEAEAIKAEEHKLAQRRQSAERKAERMRGYMETYAKGENLKTPRVVIGWRKSVSCPDYDLDKVPEQYHKIIPETRKLDKAALTKAIKAGEVDGFELREKMNIQIR